jgi:hypothetical protein
MNRESIVERIKARDSAVVWTASEPDRYWVYRPRKDSVDLIGEGDGLSSGIWVRGLAGIAGLFPLFGGLPRYFCRHCEDWHDSDETAEWMLLAKVDRALTESQFRGLAMRLTHPKRFNEPISLGRGA